MTVGKHVYSVCAKYPAMLMSTFSPTMPSTP